jgi:hypothetical protein
MDLNMLAVCAGQERSLAEYDALLAAARPAAHNRVHDKLATNRHRSRGHVSHRTHVMGDFGNPVKITALPTTT